MLQIIAPTQNEIDILKSFLDPFSYFSASKDLSYRIYCKSREIFARKITEYCSPRSDERKFYANQEKEFKEKGENVQLMRVKVCKVAIVLGIFVFVAL